MVKTLVDLVWADNEFQTVGATTRKDLDANEV